MASLADRVVAVAHTLIATAGMTAAVAATNVNSQAARLQSDYAECAKIQIANKISDEIKKTHRPGISGSL